jgi:hypothetical protein
LLPGDYQEDVYRRIIPAGPEALSAKPDRLSRKREGNTAKSLSPSRGWIEGIIQIRGCNEGFLILPNEKHLDEPRRQTSTLRRDVLRGILTSELRRGMQTDIITEIICKMVLEKST